MGGNIQSTPSTYERMTDGTPDDTTTMPFDRNTHVTDDYGLCYSNLSKNLLTIFFGRPYF